MKLISRKIKRASKQGSNLAFLAAGVLAVAPLLTSVAAQAAPPSSAPAWGYRDRDDRRDRDDHRDGDRDDRRDRNTDRDRDDWRNRQGGGYNQGGYGGYGGYGRNSITVTGLVTKNATGNQFWVRGDNGQGYLVSTRYQSATISQGIRVQVTGSYDGTYLTASSIRVLGYPSPNAPYGGGYGAPYGGGYGSPPYQGGYNAPYGGTWNNSGNAVNFPGTVQTVGYNDGAAFLQVRGDNGQIYNVRYRGNNALRRGQRVRVVGKYNEGTVWATSVR